MLLAMGMGAGARVEAGTFTLPTRAQVETTPGSGEWKVVERTVQWPASRTAVVVCDMWDKHWCAGATARVAEMAPRMNEVLQAARAAGALIIHCPSDTLSAYEGTPQRQLAKDAPPAPERPQGWKSLDPDREPALPIDDSDGGCDDAPQCRQGRAWSRQIATLEIAPGDAITDSGEAYNLMQARGITNVVVMGVHLNMCVLGRPFSIRNMVGLGQNVVLVRDLTDTMYNSRRPPFVSHFAGTDLMTAHIERYWCPSVTSDAFVGGAPFRFEEDRRPQVLLMIGEDEYETWNTLPAYAGKELGWRGLDVRAVVAKEDDKHRFPGLTEAIKEADLVVVSVRRRAVATDGLEALKGYLAAGKPLVGIRTANHAFAPRGADAEKGSAWPEFDAEVLGGNYQGHHGSGPVTVWGLDPAVAGHPLAHGLSGGTWKSQGSLYRVSPLGDGTQVVAWGEIPGKPKEPVAWTRLHGPREARVFYTSLGHPADFEEPAFRRLLLNAVLWGLSRPVPPAEAGLAAR
jgi:nicotinamidase-related amidase/type 1 glutamine amidotransferase